jgi:hypothetical protein
MSWLSPSQFPRHCRLRLPAIGRQQARPDGHDITEQTLARAAARLRGPRKPE